MKTTKNLILIFSIFLMSFPGFGMDTTFKSKSAIEFKSGFQKLWEDQVSFTRNYLINVLADLPNDKDVFNRLLKNQEAIGDAFKPFYGEESGRTLSRLLRDHCLVFTEILHAAMGNDERTLTAALKKGSINGKAIAGFLAGENPHWILPDLEKMIQTNLDLILGEVVSRLAKDWPKDLDNADKEHLHQLKFAALLSDGIMTQFSAKFKK